MTQSTSYYSTPRAQIGEWAVEGNAIIVKRVQVNGTEWEAVIKKEGVGVPEDFQFLDDDLLELRQRCAQIGSRLLDPSQWEIVFSEGAGVCTAFSRRDVVDYTHRDSMWADCKRVSDLTGFRQRIVSSADRMRFIPPDYRTDGELEEEAIEEEEEIEEEESEDSSAPAAPSAPSPLERHREQQQVEGNLIRILNQVPYSGVTVQQFKEGRVSEELMGDLEKLVAKPDDEGVRAMKEWLQRLALEAYDKYFTSTQPEVPSDTTREAYLADISARWVIALLLAARQGQDMDKLAADLAAYILQQQAPQPESQPQAAPRRGWRFWPFS